MIIIDTNRNTKGVHIKGVSTYWRCKDRASRGVRAGQCSAGQDRTGQDRTGQRKAGQSKAGQGRAGQGRAVQCSE